MTDKIDTPSAAYLYRSEDWAQCRDVINGQRAVKAAGEKYLPRIADGQTDSQYKLFKDRALFFAATSRTVSGMVGLIFRKAPEITLPLALETMAQTITPQGHTLNDLLESVITEVISVNYLGLLVDYPTNNPAIVTRAQASAAGIRPYISVYLAEAIIGVDFGIVSNQRRPVRVRLQEDAKTIRELVLIDGIYNIIIHNRHEDGSWIAGPAGVPLAGGKPLGFIPFQICSDEPVVTEPPRPMFQDLVDTNISHYQSAAIYTHGANRTALPTVIVTGVDPAQSDTLSIGSNSAWIIDNENAKGFMLEYGGTGLTALKDEREDKAAMMVVLGARILASEKSAVEATATHSIKRAGENSVLASLVRTVSRQVTQALTWMSAWAGIDGDIMVELNTDFVPGNMTAQELTAWVSAVQSGAISQETFFEALVDGEAVSPNLTFADEEDRRAASQADLPPVTV